LVGLRWLTTVTHCRLVYYFRCLRLFLTHGLRWLHLRAVCLGLPFSVVRCRTPHVYVCLGLFTQPLRVRYTRVARFRLVDRSLPVTRIYGTVLHVRLRFAVHTFLPVYLRWRYALRWLLHGYLLTFPFLQLLPCLPFLPFLPG